jgi:antitoxin ParD1/3/4
MTITPPHEQQDMQLEVDDLAWARSLVNEALVSLDRGEGMTLEEYRARMDERFGKLKR